MVFLHWNKFQKEERAREKKRRKKERNEGGIQKWGKGRGMEEEDSYTGS